MKPLVKFPLAVCALALLLAADNASLSGKWKVSTSIAGTDNDMVCTLSQKDGAVSGKCITDQATVEISGKVDGDKVTLSFKSEYNGTALTVNYAGAMASPGVIKGSVEVPEFGVAGEFTASRSE